MNIEIKVRRPPANELDSIKWLLDGATTLRECEERVIDYLIYLREKRRRGWELTDAIDNGFGYLERTPTY